jgi:hypothetical protein
MVTQNHLPYGTGSMSTPRTLRIVPGLFAGVLPLLLGPFSLTLFILQAGGWDRGIHLLKVAERPWGLFFWVCVGCTFALAFALFSLAVGRQVPVLLLLTLALLPWLAGVGLALYEVRVVTAMVGDVTAADQFTVLLSATSELLWMRLLGMWASTTLLLACVGGLVITGVGAPGAPEQDAASGVSRRLLEATVLLLLLGVGLTRISETRGLAQVLSALSTSGPAEMAPHLEEGARELRGIASLHSWALGALVLGAVALGVQRLTRRPRDVAGLAALGAMALVVAGTFWVDGRPLVRLEQRIEGVTRLDPVLAGLQLLPLGGNWPINDLEVVVTERELRGPAGTRVTWSEGDPALVDFLVRAHDEAEKVRPHIMYKRSAVSMDDSRLLSLALDARMTTHQLRRLIAAGIEAKLQVLTLLTKRNLDAEDDVSARFRAVAAAHPFLQRLGATMEAIPGAIRVYLPPAFQEASGSGRNRSPYSLWAGEVGAEREVRLSPWPAREGQEPVVLALSGPEEAASAPPKDRQRLYLRVREEAALVDVAHTVRRAQARGFTVVLTTAPPPAELPED